MATRLLRVFVAQGRTLATSPALGNVVAHALVPDAEPDDLGLVASFDSRVVGDEVELLGPSGMLDAHTVVIDLGDDGVHLGPRPRQRPTRATALDPDVAVRAVSLREALRPLPVDDGHDRRVGALALGRTAASHEILGVVEHLLAVGVQYAHDRVQFGRPIGEFQAVQQLLAEAHVQLCALREACRSVAAVSLRADSSVAAHDAALLKALAGRTAHRVGQTVLQVLGAIGFTWEHEYHRSLKRALTLDALLGSFDELVHTLGAEASGGALLRSPVV